MMWFLLILQVLIAVGLILAVLLHTAKGEGLGGIGGQAKLFGTQKGLEQGLNKITTILAVLFVLVSIILGLMMKG
jgi:preprotein translocase subunit SecG